MDTKSPNSGFRNSGTGWVWLIVVLEIDSLHAFEAFLYSQGFKETKMPR